MPAFSVPFVRRLQASRARLTRTAAALLLALAVPLAAAPSTPDVPVVLELSDALRAPSRTVDVPFEINVVVRAVDRPFEPYLTCFDPTEWACLEAWSDELFLWRSEHFARSSPCLFVRRASAAALTLAERRPYERILVTGFVRQVFAGRPWIEVVDVRLAPESLTEPTIFHAARAIELFEQGRADLGESEMERALAAPMPARQRSELERVRASFQPQR